MSNPAALPAFRELPLDVVQTRLRELRQACRNNESMDPELLEFAEGFLTHMVVTVAGAFEYVERMTRAVDKLPQSHQGKECLLADLHDYVLASPNVREKIKDRISKGLVGKTPEPEKKKSKKSVVEVSGRAFEFAEGLGPDD